MNKKLIRFVLLGLGAVVQANQAPASEDVFAVSPIYGLRPDGKVLELKGGEFGALKVRNVHWDAATRTIHLYAARNEEAAVQLVLPQAGAGYTGRMDDLSGPGAITAERARFSARCWVQTKDLGLVPDLVIPLDGSVKGIRSFDVPLAFEGLPKPENRIGLMLFEVWVPKTAKPGTYKGVVRVMKGEAEAAALNLELQVFDFALPDMPTFTFDLLTYGMPSEGLGAASYINESGLGKPAKRATDAAKKIDYQSYRLAADHRCFINNLPYHSQRGHPRYAYPVAGKGGSAKIMSFEEWDEYFGPILDGKCSKFGEPPAHFTLAFNANYPHICEGEPAKQFDWYPFKASIPEGPGKDPRLKEFEETNRAIAEQYIDHFAAKGWTKTRFEVYHNQKANKERSRLPWKLDEPVAGTDYQALRYFFNVAKWAFASAKEKGVQVVTRIDIGHFHCDRMETPDGKVSQCLNSKQYDTHGARDLLRDVTDHWCIGANHSEGACHLLKEYEHAGVKFIRYGFNKRGIGFHYGEYAGEGFKSARMGYAGRVLYQLNPVNPNNYDLSSSTAYDGRCAGFEGLFAPHRMKLWRDAVNEFEYIVEARKKDRSATDSILEKMARLGPSLDAEAWTKAKTKGYWVTNNVEDFLRAKILLAAVIGGSKPPQGMQIEGNNEKFSPCGTKDGITGYD